MKSRPSVPEDLIPLTPLWFEILLSLGSKRGHGYGLMKDIQERSGGRIDPATGTMYLALQRMEDLGLIHRDPVSRKGGGPARSYYRITPLGRRVARAEAQRLRASLNDAVAARLLPDES